MPEIRILKSGETDIDSTDIWRFSFHSKYPTFKINNSGSHNITILAGQDEAYYDIVHNLNTEPIYFPYILKGTTSKYVPGYLPISGTTVQGESDIADVSYYAVLINANTLRIGVYLPYDYALGNETFTVYWTIMEDEY